MKKWWLYALHILGTSVIAGVAALGASVNEAGGELSLIKNGTWLVIGAGFVAAGVKEAMTLFPLTTDDHTIRNEPGIEALRLWKPLIPVGLILVFIIFIVF